MRILTSLRSLYRGDDEATRRFHVALATFDIATIVFLVASSFFPGSPLIEAIDIAIGVAILLELIARLAASRSPKREFFNPFMLVDMVVVVSLLVPILGEGFAFLRVLRLLRLIRAYSVFTRSRPNSPFLRRNERTILAAINLGIFLFIATALVYETQRSSNDQIANYVDAFYYTVTTMTTTGYGDITLKGTWGRLLASLMMIVGVSLFLRLVQTMFRPSKVDFKCPDCGLTRHDHDAVHCKACGLVLNIEDEGLD